ncbi:MAG: aromatic ring-hydroxylating dioxygenase subunit alpha [Gammaproteobacteria bacterium]|nr:aromatic ring-hydroxylating dioxygenase subunit alpha [Gammaproteobacteria bacterium]
MPTKLDSRTRPQLPPTHYLDNRIYTDPAVFEAERVSILARTWRFVCHASEIPESYDYRLVQVAGHELVLVRGKDREIRAFYNSCAHRGARVVRKTAGRLEQGRMTCFYHLWSYDDRGRCTGISKPAGYRDSSVRKEDTGLRPVSVETLFDLVFVCLDDAAVSLHDFLGETLIETIRTPFGIADLEVFHLHRTEIQANWKLFVETNYEGYHELLHLLNRTTGVAQQKYQERQWRTHERGHVSFDHASIDYGNLNYEQRKAGMMPGMKPNGHVVINLFPDMLLNCRSTVARIDSLMPLSPTRTLLECRGLGLADDTGEVRAMRVRHHNQVWGPTGINLAEDMWAVQTQMRNMENGSSRYSVIAREEEGPMDDSSLRNFYAEWSRLTGYRAHDISAVRTGSTGDGGRSAGDGFKSVPE